MSTIEVTCAQRQFAGAVRVGEYVAWWVSDDRQSSLPMAIASHPTAAEAVADAEAGGRRPDVALEGGAYEAALVVADEGEDEDA